MKFSSLRTLVTSISVLFVLGIASGCGTSAEKGNWLVLEKTSGRNPEIVTVLRELPPRSVRERFSYLLEVAWGYRSGPNGFPVEQELTVGKELYAGIDRIVGDRGMYAMTRTGDGGRTMYYYVDDPAALEVEIRSFLASLPPISVRVRAQSDASWNSVQEVLSAVEQ